MYMRDWKKLLLPQNNKNVCEEERADQVLQRWNGLLAHTPSPLEFQPSPSPR